MQHLPGELGLKYRRKLRKLFAPAAEAEFREALTEAAGKICVDLGANLGQHTRTMAAHAAKVYAFEPDPWTAAELRKRLADVSNIEVIEAAAGTEDGTFPLYRTPSSTLTQWNNHNRRRSWRRSAISTRPAPWT
jgi:hypothetical protein